MTNTKQPPSLAALVAALRDAPECRCDTQAICRWCDDFWSNTYEALPQIHAALLALAERMDRAAADHRYAQAMVPPHYLESYARELRALIRGGEAGEAGA